MKSVKVLGTGCANCRATAQRIEQVAQALGVPVALEKVEAIQDIMAFGILATPGVVVDGAVVHSGGVPSSEKIAGWLRPDGGAAVAAATGTPACGCARGG